MHRFRIPLYTVFFSLASAWCWWILRWIDLLFPAHGGCHQPVLARHVFFGSTITRRERMCTQTCPLAGSPAFLPHWPAWDLNFMASCTHLKFMPGWTAPPRSQDSMDSLNCVSGKSFICFICEVLNACCANFKTTFQLGIKPPSRLTKMKLFSTSDKNTE